MIESAHDRFNKDFRNQSFCEIRGKVLQIACSVRDPKLDKMVEAQVGKGVEEKCFITLETNKGKKETCVVAGSAQGIFGLSREIHAGDLIRVKYLLSEQERQGRLVGGADYSGYGLGPPSFKLRNCRFLIDFGGNEKYFAAE